MRDRHSLASLTIKVQQPLTRILTSACLCAGPGYSARGRLALHAVRQPWLCLPGSIMEPGTMRTLSSHTGAAFEAGRLGHRNGAGPEGTEVVDGREEQEQRSGRVPQGGAQTNIASMFGQPELVGAPGRQKAAKRQKVATVATGFGGKQLLSIPGDHTVEDPEWVLILKNDKGNKHYHARITIPPHLLLRGRLLSVRHRGGFQET